MLKPMPPYFLVKLARTKKEKSLIIVPDTLKFMAHNMQCGEIVDVGSMAAKYFPEAKIGMTLIFHHFVEDENENAARVDHLVHQTEQYNYYVVSCTQYNGKGNETYGVWDGEKIIPSKDYVFVLPLEKPKGEVDLKELGKEIGIAPNVPMKVSAGGLLIFDGWEESRESLEHKQKELMSQVESLSKSGNDKFHVQQGVLTKQEEMQSLSNRLNKKEYIPFRIAFYNEELQKSFGETIQKNDLVYILNLASGTVVKFMENEYFVCKTNYIGIIHHGNNLPSA